MGVHTAKARWFQWRLAPSKVVSDIAKDLAPAARIDAIGVRHPHDHNPGFGRDENELAIGADAHEIVVAVRVRNAPPEVFVVTAVVLPPGERFPWPVVVRIAGCRIQNPLR